MRQIAPRRPDVWPETIEGLDAWLKACGIRNFSAREVTSHHNRRWVGPPYVVPPQALWENIYPTLALAQRIRDMMGIPIHVVSGYRSPEYNALVGGAARSLHMQFAALDLSTRSNPRLFDAIRAEALEERRRGEIVGLGLYDTFIHIDVGARERHWTGDSRSPANRGS